MESFVYFVFCKTSFLWHRVVACASPGYAMGKRVLSCQFWNCEPWASKSLMSLVLGSACKQN
jgi:hypothetical protein